MSIVDNLNNLQTNIENAKSILVNNLTEKGVTSATTSSTLTVLATSVADIPSSGGGGEWTQPNNMLFSFEDASNIIIPDLTVIKLTNTKEMFRNKTASTITFNNTFDTSNVTRMDYMFTNCGRLTSLDLSSFDTSNVTDMAYMFYACGSLKSLDLSNFDTSNVTNMGRIFEGCFKLESLDVSNWDTSNITDMSSMFKQCGSLTSLDISSFDTSNVTSMDYMFQNCKSLTSLDLSSFDTSKVTSMQYMFGTCSGLTSLDLSGWNTSNVTSVRYIFNECKSLTSLDLSSFDTSNVTSFDVMFDNCKNLEKIDGYISFKSYSSSTMSNTHFWGYSKNTSIKKITFKDIGYNTNAKQFNMLYAENWGVNTDTIPDAKQSLTDTLVTYSFDRATAGYPTCTVTLSTTTKALLTDDEIAQITAKGFTIA